MTISVNPCQNVNNVVFHILYLKGVIFHRRKPDMDDWFKRMINFNGKNLPAVAVYKSEKTGC